MHSLISVSGTASDISWVAREKNTGLGTNIHALSPGSSENLYLRGLQVYFGQNYLKRWGARTYHPSEDIPATTRGSGRISFISLARFAQRRSGEGVRPLSSISAVVNPSVEQMHEMLVYVACYSPVNMGAALIDLVCP